MCSWYKCLLLKMKKLESVRENVYLTLTLKTHLELITCFWALRCCVTAVYGRCGSVVVALSGSSSTPPVAACSRTMTSLSSEERLDQGSLPLEQGLEKLEVCPGAGSGCSVGKAIAYQMCWEAGSWKQAATPQLLWKHRCRKLPEGPLLSWTPLCPW